MDTTRARTSLPETTPSDAPPRASRAPLGFRSFALILAGVAAIAVAIREGGAARELRRGETALREALASGGEAPLAVAASALERAAAAATSRPTPHLLLGEALSGPAEPPAAGRDGEDERADEPGSPSLDPERAVAALDRALAADPFSARAHLLRGVALSRLGRADEADAAFERAVRAAPAHPDVAREVADHFLYEAIETRDARSLERARAAVTRHALLDPASLERSLALLSPFVEKLPDLAPLVPDTWEARYHWARFLTSGGYWDEGLAAFREAAAERGDGAPFLVHATVDFARHLTKLDRFEDALAALEEARLLNGGAHPEPLLVGRALLRLGRLDEAEAIYMKSLRRGAGRERRLEEIYGHYTDAGLVAEAVPFLEKVSRDVPFFYAPLRFLGSAHVSLGREREAERVLEQYVQHDRNPRAFEELYRLAVRTGQWRSATEYIRKAVLYAPDNAEYAALLRQAEEKAKGAG